MGSAKYQHDGDPRTSGPGFGVTVHGDVLGLPLRWRTPRTVFVNSMSDLFHDRVPDEYIAAVWVRMLWTSPHGAVYRRPNAPCHTYQVLTKRPGRMRSWVRRWADPDQRAAWMAAAADRGWCHPRDAVEAPWWPAVLSNVWLGVSVESQRWADVRVPVLLDTPAAVRWLSCEPLLGPIDLDGPVVDGHRPRLTYWLTGRPGWGPEQVQPSGLITQERATGASIDWVVAGGESGGAKARPMHPDWARTLRDQCAAADVPFFFKQWGDWSPAGLGIGMAQHNVGREVLVGPRLDEMGHRQVMRRVGKGRAGRELDGRIWDEYPTSEHQAEVPAPSGP
ncbi:phage Gp37/Gp68 family protein [Kutzneria viridogrisea]